MEKNRPVEERFYQPRINPLRQVAQLIQDLYDDVLDEGMVFCPGRIGKTQIVKWVICGSALTDRNGLICIRHIRTKLLVVTMTAS